MNKKNNVNSSGLSIRDPYQREVGLCLSRIRRDNAHLEELAFFMQEAYGYFAGRGKDKKPQVVLLGPGLPMEIPMAAGARTWWILGGSSSSMAWSQERVPRDADPVVTSTLGYLFAPGGPDLSEALILIPTTCDGMRKVADQLREEGFKTHLLDLPPDKGSGAMKKWERQYAALTRAVEEHLGKRIRTRDLARTRRVLEEARGAFWEFWQMTRGCEEMISPAGRLLIRDTFFLAEDKEEWYWHLERLKEEIRRSGRRNRFSAWKPGLLLMGSPLYFPNFKIPFLIEETGMEILDVADEASMALRGHPGEARLGKGRMIRDLAREYFWRDASPAYIRNETLLDEALRLVGRGDIDGVVFHILKGQMAEDFELMRLEEKLRERQIPIYRLETDYSQQDVEQLRIRMEAFSEMLGQNLYSEVKWAQ